MNESMGTNVHLYPSTLTNDSRIRKTIHCLVTSNVFDRIFLIGFLAPGFPPVKKVAARRVYLRLRCRLGGNDHWEIKLLYRLAWYVRVLSVCRRIKPVCVNAHSLAVLPCGVFIKWLYGAKLVYDAHELETEVKASTGLRKKFAKFIERIFIPFADHVIVVSDGIADWYRDVYGMRRPDVILNVPLASLRCVEKSSYFRDKFSIPETTPIALYLGGMMKGRMVDEIIKMWRAENPTWHLVIMGHGPLKKLCIEMAGSAKNIHFHDPVPMEKIIDVSSSADVGLCFLDPSCLSYYYALPNKLFEYLYAGLPVIANALPEIKRVIDSEACGWCFDIGNMKEMFRLNLPEIREKSAAALRAASAYSWDSESLKLIKIYTALGFLNPEKADP